MPSPEPLSKDEWTGDYGLAKPPSGGFSIAVPTMADRYKIYERLGEGGVGAVFRAYDTQLKRWVAIKRLFADPGTETDTDELRREADALASLRNPNIVTIFDVASDAEGMFLVMELLEGEDLSDAIEKGPLSFDDFKELANQTLEGLISAHHLHILHRDIKPENIKIERLPGGRLQSKIIDFGLARAGLKARKQTESDLGTVMGSIFYMAPEQLTRSPVDERSDLYSLGCVFYEALSGQKAFTGPTMPAVVDKHVAHEFTPLNQMAPHVPAGIVNWVHRLMAHKADDRPASAQQAIEEFRAWEKGPGSLAFGGWTAPLVPTSDVISPAAATGNATDALAALANPQRPVHRSATRSSAVPTRAAPPASAVRSSAMSKPPRKTKTAAVAQASPGENPLKMVGLIAGGVVAAILVLWMMFGGSKEDQIRPKGASSSSSTPKAPPKAQPTPAKTTPSSPVASAATAFTPSILPADICAHFIAGEGVLSDGGRAAGIGDPVLKWSDQASRGGANTLEPADSKTANAPVLTAWNAPTLKAGLKAVDFKVTQGGPKQLLHVVAPNQMPQFPKGQGSSEGPKGVTVAVVFQAAGGKPPHRVFFMGGPRGEFCVIRVDGKNNISAVARVGKPAVTLSGTTTKGNVPTVAILSWAATGEVFLKASDANGKRLEQSAGNRPMPQPLNRIEIGRIVTPDGQTVGLSEQFRGLIAEVIVYASALSREQVRDLESELRSRYFAKP